MDQNNTIRWKTLMDAMGISKGDRPKDPFFQYLEAPEDMGSVIRAAQLGIEALLFRTLEERMLDGNARDPRCKKITDKLARQLREFKATLGERAAFFLYGSLYFGDPSMNPDVDGLLITTTEAQLDEIYKLEDLLSEINRALRIESGNITPCSVEQLTAFTKHVGNRDFPDDFHPFRDVEHAFGTLLCSGSLDFVGSSVSAHNAAMAWKQQTISDIGQDPLLLLIAACSLHNVAAERLHKERPHRKP